MILRRVSVSNSNNSPGHAGGKSVNAGDAVADLYDASNLGHLQLAGELLDFLFDDWL